MILNDSLDYILFFVSICFFVISCINLVIYFFKFYIKDELIPFTVPFHELRYKIVFSAAISNSCSFFVYKFPSSMISGLGAVAFLLLTFMEIKNIEFSHQLEKKEKENGNKKD